MTPISRPGLAAMCGLTIGLLARAASADELPRQDPDRPVTCFTDKQGVRWRGQCTASAAGRPGRCVVAPDGETDERGVRVRDLERARYCNADRGFDLAAMRGAGSDFLQKPYQLRELGERVRTLLDA